MTPRELIEHLIENDLSVEELDALCERVGEIPFRSVLRTWLSLAGRITPPAHACKAVVHVAMTLGLRQEKSAPPV